MFILAENTKTAASSHKLVKIPTKPTALSPASSCRPPEQWATGLCAPLHRRARPCYLVAKRAHTPTSLSLSSSVIFLILIYMYNITKLYKITTPNSAIMHPARRPWGPCKALPECCYGPLNSTAYTFCMCDIFPKLSDPNL